MILILLDILIPMNTSGFPRTIMLQYHASHPSDFQIEFEHSVEVFEVTLPLDSANARKLSNLSGPQTLVSLPETLELYIPPHSGGSGPIALFLRLFRRETPYSRRLVFTTTDRGGRRRSYLYHDLMTLPRSEDGVKLLVLD